MKKYLITGLGNIGDNYSHTRHNVGFMVVDYLAKEEEASFITARLGDVAHITYRGCSICLLKPATYMNLSGSAVRYWLQELKIPIHQSLVITDDLHLPLGCLRLRPKGGDGGHNGLKHISQLLKTTIYPRLRFGIGNKFPPGQQRQYVLKDFTLIEEEELLPAIEKASKVAKMFCRNGIEMTMNSCNTTMKNTTSSTS